MTEPIVSPFISNRWEQEDASHQYFIASSDYKKLRDARKSCFVVGRRGSGKTSLLKVLNWQERRKNSSLSRANRPFRDGILGSYFGLQYLGLQVFDLWGENDDPLPRYQVFSTYLRALWIEDAVSAVRTLRLDSDLSDLSEEVHCLSAIVDDFNAWFPPNMLSIDPADRKGPLSLSKILRTATAVKNELYGRASLGALSPARTVKDLNLQSFASLTNRLFAILVSLIPASLSQMNWVFQMCMDEGEYLSEHSKLCLRSMVRECQSPLLMTVASLEDLGTSTINSDVHLNNYDREILDLRRRTDASFMNLINGIVSERLKALSGADRKFKIQELLGSSNLNELLLSVTTENVQASQILEKWQRQWRDGESGGSRAWTPIRAVLRSAGGEVVDSVEDLSAMTESRAVLRQRDSAGYRKRIVAGYFGALQSLQVEEPRYSGHNIVVSMLENSLRDALIFLQLCFEQFNSDRQAVDLNVALTDFLRAQPLRVKIQDGALKQLGKRKLESVGDYVLNGTSVAHSVVLFFASLTHALDFRPIAIGGASPERTWFVIRDLDRLLASGPPAWFSVFWEVVGACEREGYLVVDRADLRSPRVRCSRSLARFSGFSYRMPQYEFPLQARELEFLVALQSEDEVVAAAKRIVTTRSRNSDQHLSLGSLSEMPLFEMDAE